VDLEAKKQAAGCNGEDTACMTAIAGAFGADYVASADLRVLGHAMLLAFKVIAVRSSSDLALANPEPKGRANARCSADLRSPRTPRLKCGARRRL